MLNLKVISYIGIAAIAGVLVGRYVIKPKTEIKTKEVIKYVEVFKEKKEERKNIKVVVVEKPDGTKETTTTDNSTSTTTTNSETKAETKKEMVAKSGSGITLAALAIKDANDFGRPMEYGATVTVPVFGSLSVQGLATTDKRVGIGLALSF